MSFFPVDVVISVSGVLSTNSISVGIYHDLGVLQLRQFDHADVSCWRAGIVVKAAVPCTPLIKSRLDSVFSA